MDGVLSNWIASTLDLFEYGYNDPLTRKIILDAGSTETLIRKKDLWREVDRAGEDFWSTMKPFPWTNQVFDLCKRLAGKDNLYILTAPSAAPDCASGKLKWLQKHFPKMQGNHTILANHKHMFAGPNRLLIDDNTKKCNLFREYGGIAIQFPHQFRIEDDPSLLDATLRNIEDVWSKM